MKVTSFSKVVIRKRGYLVLLFLLILFESCSPGSWRDHSRKWSNTYILFSPDDLQTLYVFKNKERQDAVKKILQGEVSGVKNGNKYSLMLKVGPAKNTYRLEFSAEEMREGLLYFSGFDESQLETSEIDEEPWILMENKYILSGKELLPPENGFYELSFSEDLQN
ncbi:MAG: hypothetical protein WBV11_06760 [Salegentibacter sp.]